MLAAVALTLMSFHWLFVGTAMGFAVSAGLVITARIPNMTAATGGSFRERITVGVRIFAGTPRLRGLLGLNLVVAAAGSVVMVNTVNYVRDVLGRTQSGVALLLAANGFGTMLVALALPRVLDRRGARPIMLTGAVTLLAALGSAIALSFADSGDWRGAAAIAVWAGIGAGTAAILTPTGQVLRRSSRPAGRPALFAAQFSLSHTAWLLTYPIAGWLTTATGFTTTWVVFAILGATGFAAALRLWPRHDPEVLTHLHEVGTIDPARLGDAVRVDARYYRHTHAYVIDAEHPRWPTASRRLVEAAAA
ncbi:MFS transporter [Nocardia sp. NPDC050193]